jgi:hypothetical protein
LKETIKLYPDLNNIVLNYFMNSKQYILDSIFSSDENMNLAFKNFLLHTFNVSVSNNAEEDSSYLNNPNMDNVIENQVLLNF